MTDLNRNNLFSAPPADIQTIYEKHLPKELHDYFNAHGLLDVETRQFTDVVEQTGQKYHFDFRLKFEEQNEEYPESVSVNIDSKDHPGYTSIFFCFSEQLYVSSSILAIEGEQITDFNGDRDGLPDQTAATLQAQTNEMVKDFIEDYKRFIAPVVTQIRPKMI
jgi:hypothetical protein